LVRFRKQVNDQEFEKGAKQEHVPLETGERGKGSEEPLPGLRPNIRSQEIAMIRRFGLLTTMLAEILLACAEMVLAQSTEPESGQTSTTPT
jgi:hypothetical protein